MPDPVPAHTSSSSHGLLDELLFLVGQNAAGPDVEITGADPVLPTRFRIGELGAVVIAGCALQAARIWQSRTGRAQHIQVAVDAAAAAMRSARYIRPDPGPAHVPRRAAGLGTYRTQDGRWIYFQRLFPHHRARLAEVLDAPDDEDAIDRAVSGWDGLALEEAVVQNGACAAIVRSAAEWSAHEQARALEELPVLEVLKIAHSEPAPLPSGNRPLGGLRVVDTTRVLAGPTCGRTLAEYGADVLRVGTHDLPDNDDMMRDTGHGKRSCALDLKSADGNRQLRSLVSSADVFAQGYRPGAMARLGFAPEELAALRPGLIAVSISAFGHDGPWRERRGFDSIIQAVSGLADLSADADGRPQFLPANPLDYTTGYLAAFGTMVALQRRATEGGTYLVRLSLAQTGRWLVGLPLISAEDAAACGPDLPPQRLDELMVSRDTPFGRLRYLAPIARLGETPGMWTLPTAPLDHDQPQWQ